jgi:raffinose synthase
MLGFFAAASDFTRRLTSVRANAKFASAATGPDIAWTVRPP